MSCAACSARVEKAVSGVPGVTACSVSLLTNSMGVEGTASPAAVVEAVEKAGYGAQLKGSAAKQADAGAEADALRDRETPVLRRRLITSLGFLLVLMYFSMGHTMFSAPVPQFFSENPAALGLLQLLLAAAVMIVNQKFFVNGFRGLIRGAPNMDTLVAMGSAAAFAYSTAVLFVMTGKSSPEEQHALLHEFYFESAAMILALITVGKMLEARSKGRTTDALRSLMALAPETARVLRDGEEIEIPAGEIKKGDIFTVRPGEKIPADGVVTEGFSAVNEAALTGESIPVDKVPGEQVSAATLNQSGFLRCEATRVGEDTVLSKIIRMVSDAAATKAPIARIADRVSGIFVPAVLAIAAVTVTVWLLLGKEVGFALARGISVLVISCPCALGLATPVAIMVGNGVGAKNGILFKTSAALEECGRIQIVALDKTGTVTKGEPAVTGIYPADGISEEELLRKAAALEAKSEHPLARAVLRCAEERGIGANDPAAGFPATGLPEIEAFRALPGNGLEGTLGGTKIAGGNESFIGSLAENGISGPAKALADALAEDGKTPLFFAEQNDGPWRLLGVIAAADIIREDSAEAVREFRNMGIRTVLLTGDNPKTARAVAGQAGIAEEDVVAGVLPDGKESVIRSLGQLGKVAMVGDGINDAPALTLADVGIAVGAGTDVAIDAGDVVLMKNGLRDAAAAVRLSRATLRIIHENLFWAFFYNCIGIPLAAGVFIGITGWQLNPMFGAAAMSLSSFCVVSNALRLNFVKLYDPSGDRPIRPAKGKGRKTINAVTVPAEITGTDKTEKTEKEDKTMKKVMKIEGMMCPHCEARVKKALEAVDGVISAAPDHEKNEAVLELSKDVPAEALTAAVTDAGYEVKGIE